jgi:hypothetical protein
MILIYNSIFIFKKKTGQEKINENENENKKKNTCTA